MTVLNDDALSAYYGPDRLEAIYYGDEVLEENWWNYVNNPWASSGLFYQVGANEINSGRARTNIILDPVTTNSSTLWTRSGMSTVLVDGDWMEMTTTATATTFLSTPFPQLDAAVLPSAPNALLAGVEVLRPAGAPPVSVRVGVFQYNGATQITSAQIIGANTVLQEGVPTRVELPEFFKDATATAIRFLLYVHTPAVAYTPGLVVRARKFYLGESGPYFDGSQTNVPGTVTGWGSASTTSGETPNASMSVLVVNNIIMADGTGPFGPGRSFYRRTVGRKKTGATSGPYYRDSPGSGVTSAKAGPDVAASMYIRSSTTTSVRSVANYRAGGSTTASFTDTEQTALPAGEWIRLASLLSSPIAYDNLQQWALQDSGIIVPAGTTLDVTCLAQTKAPLRPYRDGYSAEWRWQGPVGASQSYGW